MFLYVIFKFYNNSEGVLIGTLGNYGYKKLSNGAFYFEYNVIFFILYIYKEC